ncbi:MAG: hypothetical protein V4671_11640 [Armatimonadota bacterium]
MGSNGSDKSCFLLFAYDYYYPSGGAADCLGVFRTLEEAEQAYKGDQEAAEVAVIHGGRLEVVSRGFSTPNREPRKVEWSRESEVEPASLAIH